ncbi:MAG: Glycerone kinase [Solirubrobacterales bacterium]|nr:Glycerone kinase [Solirubrobacterales bacterium]
MTRVYDDPARFKDDAIDGFAQAYARYVARVPGASGFVRAGAGRPGKVSVVVGGGSGHYPSYAGIVGPGFADGCVLGDLFTSPSLTQVHRVARAAEQGGGLVLSFGNYAGDRLNFGAAQERLAAEGIDTRIVYVTDDIASGSSQEVDRRRGIAGTFTVYKVGGAAADRGDGLDTVERLMRAANAATFSFGVAFDGCTLPGQAAPLFTVETGRMEFGLGIHGEAGIRSTEWMPAPLLAQSLVDSVLAERPQGAGPRAAVLVNGLGATKYEELFVLYGHVHRLLAAAGVEAVLPEVGELVTSLDMAGCSLSVTWLDDELEQCWRAPADTVAFRRGQPDPRLPRVAGVALAATAPALRAVEKIDASEASIAAAAVARDALDAMLATVVAHEEELGRIDAVAGDGDHGLGMVRGLGAAVDAAGQAGGGAGTVLSAAGEAFADVAGGTSGILWGLFLSTIGTTLGDVEPVTGVRICAALRAGAGTLQRVGQAELGQKTMLDALLPFVDALDGGVEAGAPLAEAWLSAADTAERAAAETAALTPKVGRARPLAARSVGTPDAGATSMALIARAVGSVLASPPCAAPLNPSPPEGATPNV